MNEQGQPSNPVLLHNIGDPLATAITSAPGVRTVSHLDEASTVVHHLQHSDAGGLEGLHASLESLHRLVDTVRTSSHVKRVVLVGDMEGLRGQRLGHPVWRSSHGVSLTDQHGMESLIAEVLVKSLAKGDREVVLIRTADPVGAESAQAVARAVSIPSEILLRFQEDTVPDLDGWVAVCVDPEVTFQGDLTLEAWLGHTRG